MAAGAYNGGVKFDWVKPSVRSEDPLRHLDMDSGELGLIDGSGAGLGEALDELHEVLALLSKSLGGASQ